MDGEAGSEHVPVLLGQLPETDEGRPGALGVHVVCGDGRNASPVVDARPEQAREVVCEVRRCLHMDLRSQHQPGCRDRPQVLLGRAWGRFVHGGPRLGEEVLHDHLLDVPVPGVAGGDGAEGDEAVSPRLADADEEAGREGDLEPAGRLQGGEAPFRRLVGRGAVAVEVRCEGLEHHALADGHLAESRQLVFEQGACIGVREEPGLGGDEPAALDEVLDGGGKAVLGEPCGGGGVAQLGAFPEGEEGLMAAGRGTGAGDGQNLLRAQVGRREAGGRLGKGAVAAPVLAEHGEGDEHLRGEGDPLAESAVPDAPRLGHELGQRHRQDLGVARASSRSPRFTGPSPPRTAQGATGPFERLASSAHPSHCSATRRRRVAEPNDPIGTDPRRREVLA